jgi:hypothetical protein
MIRYSRILTFSPSRSRYKENGLRMLRRPRRKERRERDVLSSLRTYPHAKFPKTCGSFGSECLVARSLPLAAPGSHVAHNCHSNTAFPHSPESNSSKASAVFHHLAGGAQTADRFRKSEPADLIHVLRPHKQRARLSLCQAGPAPIPNYSVCACGVTRLGLVTHPLSDVLTSTRCRRGSRPLLPGRTSDGRSHLL